MNDPDGATFAAVKYKRPVQATFARSQNKERVSNKVHAFNGI